MQKITFESNVGNFNYRLTAIVGDEVNAESVNLCKEGLANLGFRAGASAGFKALLKLGFLTKEDKRDSVRYWATVTTKGKDGEEITHDAVEVIESAVQAKLDELAGDKDKPLPAMEFIITGEHTSGETEASRKQATAMWGQVMAKSEPARAAMLVAIGVMDGGADEVAGIEACHTFLRSLVAKKAA